MFSLEDSLINEIIDEQYLIVNRITGDPTGIVFRAKQLSLKREVFLKIVTLAQGETTIKRFLKEAALTIKLEHPHNVRVFDYGFSKKGLFYIVMESLSGLTLLEHVKKDGSLSGALSLQIAIQACEALQEAHNAKILHRGINPYNIFLSFPNGTQPFVKLMGFSLYRHYNHDNLPDQLQNTDGLMYLSPEQLVGDTISERTDIYSLGMTLYFGLLGKNPYPEKYILPILKAQKERQPDFRGLPDTKVYRHLVHCIQKCVQKSPERRFSSIQELKDALLSDEFRDTESPLVELEPIRSPPKPAVPQKDVISETPTQRIVAKELNTQIVERLIDECTQRTSFEGAPKMQVYLQSSLIPLGLLQTKRLELQFQPSPSDPTGNTEGITPGLRFLFIGDLSAASGLSSYQSSVAHHFSKNVSLLNGRSVCWESYGLPQSDLKHLSMDVLPNIPAGNVDAIFLFIGTSDLLGLISLSDWKSCTAELIQSLQNQFGQTQLIINPVPPLHLLPSLPWLLKSLWRNRAQAMNAHLEQLVKETPKATLIRREWLPHDILLHSNGITLNERGHKLMAAILYKELLDAEDFPFLGETVP
ncbi:MAG: protein kinase [Myxococcota bacterium]|nr:protein kinase [Myxococcota bacterium]